MEGVRHGQSKPLYSRVDNGINHVGLCMTAVTERIATLFGVLWLAVSLAGCGNKGPLYLPDDEPALEKPAETVSGPAETEPEHDEPDTGTEAL